jgi:hypothetical protein
LIRSDKRGRSPQLQLEQLLNICAAGAENVADIGAAGQVTHAEPQQPALELEILAHTADSHCLAVTLCRSSDGLKGGAHPLVRVLPGYAHFGRRCSTRHRQLGGPCRACAQAWVGVVGWDDDTRSRPLAGYRFPIEIISHAVWLYFRFPLGLHMVEELLAARGIIVSHETDRRP